MRAIFFATFNQPAKYVGKGARRQMLTLLADMEERGVIRKLTAVHGTGTQDLFGLTEMLEAGE